MNYEQPLFFATEHKLLNTKHVHGSKKKNKFVTGAKTLNEICVVSCLRT